MMAETPASPGLPQAYGSTTPGRNRGDYADRYYKGILRLDSGQEISLAMVADGFGEQGLAASVAQLAIDTVLEYLHRASLTDLPDLLDKAYQVANKRIAEVARRHGNRPLSSTLAVAAVLNKKLCIANVGNSRIYLVRGGQMLLLTIDHTVAFEQISSGRMNSDQALRQPNAQQLARSLGFDPQFVKTDLGLYLQGGGETREVAYQQQGLELHSDDLVLVCSDGLIKPLAGKGPLASRDEIRKLLESSPAQAAASSLSSLAAQRLTPEDVTAVILEMPDRPLLSGAMPAQPQPQRPPVPAGTPTRKTAAHPNRTWPLIALVAILGILILVAITVGVIIGYPLLIGKATATSSLKPSEIPPSIAPATPTLAEILPIPHLNPRLQNHHPVQLQRNSNYQHRFQPGHHYSLSLLPRECQVRNI
jgi:serine/threonine protein phosphatase PrpC